MTQSLSDPAFASLVAETIRRTSTERLRSSEEALLRMPVSERLAIARWIVDTLNRPPLTNRNPGWDGLRSFLQALWEDIYELTPDPDDPLGLTPHPDLVTLFRG